MVIQKNALRVIQSGVLLLIQNFINELLQLVTDIADSLKMPLFQYHRAKRKSHVIYNIPSVKVLLQFLRCDFC